MIRRIIGVGAVLVLLGALCVVVFQRSGPPLPSVTLPNGNTLTFLGARYGTNEVFVWGRDYQRSLYKILPPKLKQWSGAAMIPFLTVFSNEPSLWVFESGPHESAHTVFLRPVDEYGCEYDTETRYDWTGVTLRDSGGCIYGFQAGVSYLRGKMAGFSVFDNRAREHRLKEFALPGGASANVPELKPGPAPQQAGDLSIQLTRLVSGIESEEYLPGKTNTFLFSQAAFRVTRDGKPAPEWFAAKVRLTDSKGRRVKQGDRHLTGRRGDETVYNFESVLDPAAGPLKLRAEFVHVGNFSADELVNAGEITVPGVATNLQSEVQGQEIGLGVLVTVGYPVDGDGGALPLTVSIQVDFKPPTNTWHLQLASAVDEGGNDLYAVSKVDGELDDVHQFGTLSAGKGTYSFLLATKQKPKSLKLTFVVHQSRFPEFEATPMVMGAPANSGR